MKKTAMLLALAMILSCVVSLGPAPKVEASYIDDFLNVIGPMATIDMRDNHILASFTIAQAIWESGWGRSTLATVAYNLFGITATKYWDGKVYDTNEKVMYPSFDALVAAKGNDYVYASRSAPIFWRAYDSWQESVSDHSALFNNMDIYKKLRGNYDYKSCAVEVVNAGYCSGSAYTDAIIKMVEDFDLEQYNYDFNSEIPEGPGADSVSLKPGAVYMDKGASLTLTPTVTPTDASYIIRSSNSSVARVDGKVVSAVSDGKAVITLSSGSLSVSCNVTVKTGYNGIVVDGVYTKCTAKGGTVAIPGEATVIAAGAFEGSGVQKVVVGNSVTKVEDGAFNGVGSGFSLMSYGNKVVADYANKNAIECVSVVTGWVLESGALLTGMSVYTTVDIVAAYYSASGVKATVSSGGVAMAGTDYVGTGCVVKVGGASYTVSIKGDVDGNGITTTADLIKMKSYLSGVDTALPARAYRKAADFNSDERITTSDYLSVLRSMK